MVKFIVTIEDSEFDAYFKRRGYGIKDTAISDLLQEIFETVQVEEA